MLHWHWHLDAMTPDEKTRVLLATLFIQVCAPAHARSQAFGIQFADPTVARAMTLTKCTRHVWDDRPDCGSCMCGPSGALQSVASITPLLFPCGNWPRSSGKLHRYGTCSQMPQQLTDRGRAYGIHRIPVVVVLVVSCSCSCSCLIEGACVRLACLLC